MIGYLSLYEKQFEKGLIGDLVELYNKIEKWWFRFFELGVNPGLIGGGVDPEEVIPGSIITIRLMLEIVFGAEPTDGYYYNEFLKISKNKSS